MKTRVKKIQRSQIDTQYLEKLIGKIHALGIGEAKPFLSNELNIHQVSNYALLENFSVKQSMPSLSNFKNYVNLLHELNLLRQALIPAQGFDLIIKAICELLYAELSELDFHFKSITPCDKDFADCIQVLVDESFYNSHHDRKFAEKWQVYTHNRSHYPSWNNLSHHLASYFKARNYHLIYMDLMYELGYVEKSNLVGEELNYYNIQLNPPSVEEKPDPKDIECNIANFKQEFFKELLIWTPQNATLLLIEQFQKYLQSLDSEKAYKEAEIYLKKDLPALVKALERIIINIIIPIKREHFIALKQEAINLTNDADRFNAQDIARESRDIFNEEEAYQVVKEFEIKVKALIFYYCFKDQPMEMGEPEVKISSPKHILEDFTTKMLEYFSCDLPLLADGKRKKIYGTELNDQKTAIMPHFAECIYEKISPQLLKGILYKAENKSNHLINDYYKLVKQVEDLKDGLLDPCEHIKTFRSNMKKLDKDSLLINPEHLTMALDQLSKSIKIITPPKEIHQSTTGFTGGVSDALIKACKEAKALFMKILQQTVNFPIELAHLNPISSENLITFNVALDHFIESLKSFTKQIEEQIFVKQQQIIIIRKEIDAIYEASMVAVENTVKEIAALSYAAGPKHDTRHEETHAFYMQLRTCVNSTDTLKNIQKLIIAMPFKRESAMEMILVDINGVAQLKSVPKYIHKIWQHSEEGLAIPQQADLALEAIMNLSYNNLNSYSFLIFSNKSEKDFHAQLIQQFALHQDYLEPLKTISREEYYAKRPLFELR